MDKIGITFVHDHMCSRYMEFYMAWEVVNDGVIEMPTFVCVETQKPLSVHRFDS